MRTVSPSFLQIYAVYIIMINEKEQELADILSKSCTNLQEIEALIKRLFKKTIEQMLETEMDEHIGYIKNDSVGNNSGNSRNGYNKKTIQSEFGKVEVKVPRDRNGEFTPKIIEKYQKKTENLDYRVIEMYARGMSNRDIEEHMRNIYGVNVSASLISRITDKIIPEARTWQTRTLKTVYPIVYFNGIAFKVRSEGKMTEKHVYTALGIDTEGGKDILGLWIAENESKAFWEGVCVELKKRAVGDIFIGCYDNLNDLPAVLTEAFPATERQLCIIHQVSDSTKFVPYKDRQAVTADLKEVYGVSAINQAEDGLKKFKEKWDGQYPQVSQLWEERWQELTTFFRFEKEVRHIIYTANLSKGFQRMLRKYTKSKIIYPTDDALYKSVYLSIREITKKWNVPVPNWDIILGQLAVFFGGRLN